MKIIRCVDGHNNILYAKIESPNKYTALTGNLTSGFTSSEQQIVPKKILAPVVPCNIFAIGLNYQEHAREAQFDKSANPVVFLKATSSLNNPFDPIVTPACSSRGPETDYEGELAVIIGKPAKNVSVAAAMDHVFGYCCANDISARRWQKHAGAGQWARGKSFDTFCPMGPMLVTKDEIENPHNLSIKTTLNEKIMQQSNTSEMIYQIPELIAYLSQDTTLLSGTVILTGTPDGVGFVRDPRVFLHAGDVVKVAIEGLGCLENPVHSGHAAPEN